MKITTLEHASLATITEAFNAAFIDYKIRLRLSEEDMAAKIRSENIQLQYSAGAYDGEKLVGFILHGTDIINGEPAVYNAGTGTLPDYRNQGIARRLYQFIVPYLLPFNFRKHQLEVFDDNTNALRVYTGIGFRETRKLNCYRGLLRESLGAKGVVVELIADEAQFKTFWNYHPTWQNDFPAIKRNPGAHKIIGIKHHHELVAYAIYAPLSGRVRQFAVKQTCRRMGFGKQLFYYMSNHCPATGLVVTNVQEDAATHAFFDRIGFSRFLGMYEMHMEVAADA